MRGHPANPQARRNDLRKAPKINDPVTESVIAAAERQHRRRCAAIKGQASIGVVLDQNDIVGFDDLKQMIPALQ
ncbi:hypothetical protein D3C72_1985830 [compost metagenome]